MLCSLDDFVFEAGLVDIDTISQTKIYRFNNTPIISGFDDYQATGKYSNEFNLSGVLIKKSNKSLHDLEALADKKKPVTLAFESGIAYKVLIVSLKCNKSDFIQNGLFLQQNFTVSLKALNQQTL